MYPSIILFGREIPTYWIMAMLGAVTAYLYAYFTNRGGKAGRIRNDDLLHIVLLAALGAIVGAKVLSVLTNIPVIIRNWAYLIANPELLLALLGGGLIFYGGMIGGLIAVWLYCRRYEVPIKSVVGVMTPIIPLFHVFGRIGCFLGGCCWGIEVPWGVVYSHSLSAPNGVPLLPIQLIESGCNLLLFLFLAILSRRLSPGKKWLTFPAYIVGYGVLRFVLEFFRGDKMRGVYLLSTSQWISLGLIGAVVVLYFVRWRKQLQNPEEPPPSSDLPPTTDADISSSSAVPPSGPTQNTMAPAGTDTPAS